MLNIQNSSLLAQIQKRAEAEVDQINKESKDKLYQKVVALEEQKKQMIKQMQQDTQKQIDLLERTLSSRIEIEKKHIQLKQQELVMKNLLQQVYKHMQELIQSAEYPQILVNWICEAALALPEDQLVIQTSREEIDLLTPSLLQKASLKIEKQDPTRKVTFSVDKENLILDQGIIVSLPNYKLLFSNTVKNRITRYDTYIHTYAFKTIFKD